MYTFHANSEVFLEFFERVKAQKADKEEDRIKILIGMIKEGFPISVGRTSRSKEEIVKDYAKHGKVLWLKPDTMEGGIEDGNTNGL